MVYHDPSYDVTSYPRGSTVTEQGSRKLLSETLCPCHAKCFGWVRPGAALLTAISLHILLVHHTSIPACKLKPEVLRDLVQGFPACKWQNLGCSPGLLAPSSLSSCHGLLLLPDIRQGSV